MKKYTTMVFFILSISIFFFATSLESKALLSSCDGVLVLENTKGNDINKRTIIAQVRIINKSSGIVHLIGKVDAEVNGIFLSRTLNFNYSVDDHNNLDLHFTSVRVNRIDNVSDEFIRNNLSFISLGYQQVLHVQYLGKGVFIISSERGPYFICNS
ncbi:hypothetical protein [Serratia marcescens]|uniref:hypothetical protein n=1 Tax=Serratia marcescens TaxID=615 RepID=UPI0014613306|nr:hypothetical protein [Serratia marcescens]MBH2706753.1 hypothetical protein [Serratia marcescens]MBH3191434.1 hypothetical protein [Serratia marcescens]MBN5254069.1 hypothetical protein [Serratia marcescens]NMQ39731.1 hypothetical protein [Serratia marcescens]